MAVTSSAPGHTRIDNRIPDFFARRVGAIAVAVYLVLCRFADAVTRQCHPSIRRIAEMLGLSRPTVLKAIGKLEEEGLVKVERGPVKQGKRLVNVYTLLPVGEAPSALPRVVNVVDRHGQSPLPPLVNHVDHDSKGALPEQDLINKTQEDKRGRAYAERAPAPAPSLDLNLDHPAVTAYRARFKLMPNEAQRAKIAAVVTDMARWQEVLEMWESRGWWKANVEGMLDRYKNETSGRSGSNGRNARSGRLGFEGSKAYDRRESRPPETPEERARRDAEFNKLKQSQNRSQHDEA